MNIGCCCTLAAKIQSAFYERNFCFLLRSAMSLPLPFQRGIFSGELSLKFSGSHCSLRSTFCFQFPLYIGQFDE